MMPWVDPLRIKTLLLAGLLTVSGLTSLLAGEIVYSFRDGDSGGLALVSLDETSGKIASHETVFLDSRLSMAHKVRFSSDGTRLVVSNDSEEPPYAVMARPWPPTPAKVVDLPETADEVRAWGDRFLASCGGGEVSLFDASTGEVKDVWKGKKKLDPPGSRPEDIFLLPEEELAVVSFQKDNKSGSRLGNRIVLLDLKKFKHVSDLQLPRSHPDLHLPGNPKEQGPSPEVVLASVEAGTIFATLDLYGAVAMFDLKAARKGELKDLVYLPVSLDGSWGSAFPDRATLLPLEGGTLAMVVNAGAPGGTTLVDLKNRQLVRQWPTPTGLEVPTWVEEPGLAVSVRSGKTKRRQDGSLVKEFHPGRDLYVFDLSKNEDSLRTFPLGIRTSLVTAVPGGGDHLVLVFGQGEAGYEMLVVDPSTGRILDRQATFGHPQRCEARPVR